MTSRQGARVMANSAIGGAEMRRLEEDALRNANWKRWGPYLAERQWATVREDYSSDGGCWTHFSHDDARAELTGGVKMDFWVSPIANVDSASRWLCGTSKIRI